MAASSLSIHESTATGGKLREWRANGILVFVSCIGASIAAQAFYTIGIFIGPLEADMGWSRAQITFGLMIASSLGVLFAPFVGLLIDRWGARRIAIPGVIIYCTAFGALSSITSSIWSYWACFLLMAIGQTMVAQMVWVTAVARQFVASRGIAVAVTLCGASLGAMIFPPLAEALISLYGWRFAYVGMAVAIGGPTIVLLLIFFKDHRTVISRPIDEKPVEQPDQRSLGLTWREALKTWRFWCIASAALFLTMSVAALVVHFVPIVTKSGLDRSLAAYLAGLSGIAAVAGRLMEGLLLDRFRGNVVGGLSMLLPAVPCIFLASYDGSFIAAATVSILIGLAMGAETNVIAYLTSRYFGMRNYGVIFGIIVGLNNLAAGAGPALAGLIYDIYKTYDMVLYAGGTVAIFHSILFFKLGDYPQFRKE